ncbi:MAG: DUF2188 domain-containing protein [Acidobacteriaceae bacterium]
MKRIDLVHRGDEWVAKAGRKVVASAPLKKDAVRKTAEIAKADPKPVSVKIHKLNGRFQEERTYPRSADPQQSKG